VLRRANLVVARKEGNQVFYSVRSALLTDVLAAAKQLLISGLTDTQNLLADLSEKEGRP
jgi:DNA-binding transcriptional ArsR family regulator